MGHTNFTTEFAKKINYDKIKTELNSTKLTKNRTQK